MLRFESVRSSSTRNSKLLVMLKHKTVAFKRSFSYNSCKSYNSLPPAFYNYFLQNFKNNIENSSLIPKTGIKYFDLVKHIGTGYGFLFIYCLNIS